MDIHAIARANGVELREVAPTENIDPDYKNRSYCVGSIGENPVIVLGVYDSNECKELSFLHEMAHILFRYPKWEDENILTRYEWELQVWNNTYKLANEYKFYISPETMKWAHNQLATYIGWEEREVLNYRRYKWTSQDITYI